MGGERLAGLAALGEQVERVVGYARPDAEFITTADANAVDARFLASARRFRVSGGTLQALN